MAQNFQRFKNFKELDLFIQNSLNKFFFVEPWKKLYERTGNNHRDIISDKSTIPDLIIYNKTFNKSDCFFESNEKTYIKFPRMRFLLRPKYKKEYNPIDTYGKNDEVYFFNKQEISEYNNNINIPLNNKFKDEKKNYLNEPKTFLKQKCPYSLEENKIKNNNKKELVNNLNTLEHEEDKEIQECDKDKLPDSKKAIIEFKAIPKYFDDKKIKDLNTINENMYNIDLEQYEKKNIDIERFFSNNNDYNLNDIQTLEKNNIKDNLFQEIDNFIQNEKKEDKINKEEINIDNNKENHIDNNICSNNVNDLIINNGKQEDKKQFFNIFDTENKFNDIFLGNQLSIINTKNQQTINSNNDDLNNKKEINIINNKNNINFKGKNENITETNSEKEYTEEKIQNSMISPQQNKDNLIRNQNIPFFYQQNQQNSPYYYYNSFLYPTLFYNNIQYNNKNYLNNLNYKNIKGNVINSNNVNYYPFRRRIQNIGMPNTSFNNCYNLDNSVQYFNKGNNENQKLYVNNINFYLKNNNYQYNLKNNSDINEQKIGNNNSNNLSNINQNNTNLNRRIYNIVPQDIWKNKPEEENNDVLYRNENINNIIINNNKDNDINSININKNIFKEKIDFKKDLKNKSNNNNIFENKKYVKTSDYLENLNLIIRKNTEKKNWLVLNHNNSIIHNFNNEELLKFLKEREKNDKSLEEITINDYDTDFVFPAEVICEFLEDFFSHEK